MSSSQSVFPPGSSIVFRVPARFIDVRLLGISINALFSNLGFTDIETFQLELAITEAANNIVKHSYKFASGMDLNMKFTVMEDSVSCIFVDKGEFTNFLTNNAQGEIATDTVALPSSSRGICIICDVMDEVSYRRSGDKNILKLVKYLP